MRALFTWGLIVVLGCTATDGEGGAEDSLAAGRSDTAMGGAPGDTMGDVAGGGGGPVADTALGGTRWLLLDIGGAPARSMNDERAAYIEFAPAEGRASGNATCNRFSGPYTLSGSSLSFGALFSTTLACADSARNALVTALLGALGNVSGWRMAGDTLVLTGPAGELARFQAGSAR